MISKGRPSYQGSVQFDRPRTIYFYATSHCNSNCSYCVFRKSNGDLFRTNMSLNIIEQVWLESAILKTCGVVVQGGEFTIHPEATGIMRFFSLVVPKVTLLTNAVDPELAKPLIQYATQVTISLDGPQHDKSRGVAGNLDGVYALLGYLKNVGKSTTLQITLGPWNARNPKLANDNVAWFIDTCRQYDAQPRFNIASDDGLLGTANYEQKADALQSVTDLLYEFATYNTFERMKSSLISGARYINAAVGKSTSKAFIPCYSTSIYSTINANGDVWLCQGLEEKEAVVGNVLMDNFDTIWENSSGKRKDYGMCQRCSLSCQLTGDLAYLQSKIDRMAS